MKDIISELKMLGCDTASALERFAGDPELYTTFLVQVLSSDDTEMLGAAIESGDSEEAFRRGHSLKGLWGNLGLTSVGLGEKYSQLRTDFACLAAVLNN